MRKSVIAIGAGILVAAAGAATPASRAAAAPADVLYASPSGSGMACSQAAPCALTQGTQSVAANGTLIVEPGKYVVDVPIITAEGTLIEGQPGKAMPLIVSTAASDALQVAAVTHVTLHYSGPADGLVASGAINHVSVIATTGDNHSACIALAAPISNSLCVNQDAQGIALTIAAGAVNATARGVTAVDDSGFAQGIVVLEDTANTNGTATLTNVIGLGGPDGADLSTRPPSSGTDQNIAVTCSHSDFGTISANSTPGGAGSISCDDTTISAAPIFLNAATNNFEEQATSPTVDTGAPDAATSKDLAGLPRTLGAAPDMGAYEFAPKPRLSRVQVIHTAATAVTMIALVNPGGLTATVSAATGAHLAKAVTVSGDKAQHVQLVVRGLLAHHTYFLRVSAKSRGGTTISALFEAKT